MGLICSVDDCENAVRGNSSFCEKHRMRFRRHGHTEPTKRENNTGTIMASGHISIRRNGVLKYEHVWIAEEVLGKELPAGAQIHHVNLNPSDNRKCNLVICPSDAYHKLLHQRLRALEACGNPNWRQCNFCHQYDNPEKMFISVRSSCHRECRRKYENDKYHSCKKTQNASTI
jgi:hypothetical protein